MKKAVNVLLTLLGVLLIGALLAIMFYRIFYGGGDPLIPLLILVVILIGTSIYQIVLETREDMAQIKMATLMFIGQARTETEYLQAVGQYHSLLAEQQAEQRPDLN